MSIMRALGYTILSSPFVGLTLWLGFETGWIAVLKMWAAAIGITALLGLGIYLVTSGDRK